MPELNDAQAWAIVGFLVLVAVAVIAWCMEDPNADDPAWVQRIGERLDRWFGV